MRKILFAAVLAGFVGLCVVAANFPLEGPLVDSYFSKKLSGAIQVEMIGAKVIASKWGRLTFESIRIAKKGGEDGLMARNGTLKWSGYERILTARSAEFRPSAIKNTPFLGQLLGGREGEARVVRNIEIFWLKRSSGSAVRLIGLESGDFRLKGGVNLDPEDRPVKVHAQILVAPELWRRLPDDLSKRFLRRSGDFRGLRFFWTRNFIRVNGAAGPLLAAGWQSKS